MTIASIDAGTNTVLLLIAKVDSGKNISTILNEQRIPRLGKGLKPGEKIPDEKIKILFDILDDYEKLINNHRCNKILFTATNAFRIALNGGEIIEEIRKRYNFDAKIIKGEEEAVFAYSGAVSDISEHETALVIDIGGGSTEITSGKGKEILFNKSFQIGVVSGTEKFFINDPPAKNEIKEFENFIENLIKNSGNFSGINFHPDRAIAIAGTPTTLACMKLKLDKYDEEKIEGEILNKNEMKDLINHLSSLKIEEIKKKYESFINNREDLILAGSVILLKMMELTNIEKVSVSSKGIRYGAVVNYLKNI